MDVRRTVVLKLGEEADGPSTTWRMIVEIQAGGQVYQLHSSGMNPGISKMVPQDLKPMTLIFLSLQPRS